MPDGGPVRATLPARLLAPLAALLAAGGLACGHGARRVDPPNVLLITVDTLRPDHLGCYGYARRTSPAIDGLAAGGVRFSQVITAAGRTVQSFPSILMGVYPMRHGLRYEGQSQDDLASLPTLASLLKRGGYASLAVTQGLNVGLHRDFDLYDPEVYLDPQGRRVRVPTRNDREASRKAIQWLHGGRPAGRPFFLWLRYNAPHWPYDAPAPYGEMFDPDYHGPHLFNDAAGPGRERGDIIFGRTRLPAREVEHAVAHYDGEVAYADRAVADLLAAIDDLGVADRTIVVLTADHGESLGEHDYFFEHGAYLYEPNVRVPLILRAPGLPRGGVVDLPARTIDIVPTVLDLAGLAAPAGLQGESLAPRARGLASGPAPPAYSESGRNFYPENPRQYVPGVAGKWRMLRTERYKLIMIPRDPTSVWELYDLRSDPGEETNLHGRLPEVEEDLKKQLLALLAADPMRDDRGEPPLPDDLEERLRSLGYVGGGPRR
jgi:arylsulfatase A-like enzyme